MKRELNAQRPDEGVDLEADEEELIEQGATQLLREQMEETEHDEEMEDTKDVSGLEDATEQVKGAGEEENSQRKDTGQEEANTSTLPFRSQWTQTSRDKANAPFRPPTLRARPSTASFVRSEEERQAKEEKMNSASWRK